MVGELLSKPCWRGVKSNPICFGKAKREHRSWRSLWSLHDPKIHSFWIIYAALNRIFLFWAEQKNYCIETSVAARCFVDAYWVKYRLPGGSMAANKIALIPLNVCGVWIISQEASSSAATGGVWEQHILSCGQRSHATALIRVLKSWLYERESNLQ